MKSLCTMCVALTVFSMAAATSAIPGDAPAREGVAPNLVAYAHPDPMDLDSALAFIELEKFRMFSVTTIFWFACDTSDDFEILLACSRTNLCTWPDVTKWKQGTQPGCGSPYIGGVFPCPVGQSCQTVLYANQTAYDNARAANPCDYMDCPPKYDPTACCQ